MPWSESTTLTLTQKPQSRNSRSRGSTCRIAPIVVFGPLVGGLSALGTGLYSIGIPSAANFLIDWLEEQHGFESVQAVGHRIVHGMKLTAPEPMTAKIRSRTPAEERPSPHDHHLPMQSLRNKRLIIVGGVAGGASAAACARRLCEDCEIILFERGPHVSFANCGLLYFVGGEIAEQDSLLVQTSDSLRVRFNLDVRINTEVVHIDRAARRIRVREWESACESEEAATH